MATELKMIRDSISEDIIAAVSRLACQRNPDKITVRDVLKEMGITNRVFYNRFHNIDEVLEILYQDLIHKIRESIFTPWKPETNFFEHVRMVACQTLVLSYDYKKNLSHFVFETDSMSDANFQWWYQEIKKLISMGCERGLLKKELDVDCLSYSIWCYIRGFNADAMARNLSKEDAVSWFTKGFDVFLDGMRS